MVGMVHVPLFEAAPFADRLFFRAVLCDLSI